MKKKEKNKILVHVEFTEGYQERFTSAILKIYSDKLEKRSKQEMEENDTQQNEMRVS